MSDVNELGAMRQGSQLNTSGQVKQSWQNRLEPQVSQVTQTDWAVAVWQEAYNIPVWPVEDVHKPEHDMALNPWRQQQVYLRLASFCSDLKTMTFICPPNTRLRETT